MHFYLPATSTEETKSIEGISFTFFLSFFNNNTIQYDKFSPTSLHPSHYPVFHQIEGVRLFEDKKLEKMLNAKPWSEAPETRSRQSQHSLEAATFLGNDLKATLAGKLVVDDCRF